MSLKRLVASTSLLAEKAKSTNLVATNATKRLISSIAKQSLVLTNNTQRLTSSLAKNALTVKALLGKFFEFKELDDAPVATDDDIVFDIDKKFSDTPIANEQIALSVDKPFTDSYAVSEVCSLNPIKQPSDTVGGVSDSTPIFDITKGIFDVPHLTDVISFDISYTLTDSVRATDDVNGAAVGDESQLQVFKVYSDSSSASDSHALTTTKGLTDTGSIADSGLFRAQNYTSDMSYFAGDYVGQSQSF